MALEKCKECGGQVSTEAKACPHCGAKPPKRASRAGVLFIVLVIIFIVGVKFGTPDAPPVSPVSEAAAKITSQQDEAKWQCRRFVERDLKAPSTASFQDARDFTVWGTDSGPYGVKGYVDAQNSFGAKLRIDFTCTLEKKGDDWRLVELKTSKP